MAAAVFSLQGCYGCTRKLSSLEAGLVQWDDCLEEVDARGAVGRARGRAEVASGHAGAAECQQHVCVALQTESCALAGGNAFVLRGNRFICDLSPTGDDPLSVPA